MSWRTEELLWKLFFGVLALGIIGVIVWSIIVAVKGPWYGEGTVVDKGYSGSYIMSCGKSCFTSIPECYRLKVVEYNGDEHEGCVSSRVWENAMLGHHIAITPDYH